MKEIGENTVAASNQLKETSRVFFMGSESAPKRLLIVGNSITRHGPKPEIGWVNDWGMAASAREKDYVHLLQDKLTAAGKNVLTMVSQMSGWEIGLDDPDVLARYPDERAFGADAILFRLGENVPKTTDPAHFAACLRALIAHLDPKGGKVVFTTTVWEGGFRNRAITALAAERGAPLVDLTAIAHDDTLMAIGEYEHKGVAMHPSDKGMRYIADRVFTELAKVL